MSIHSRGSADKVVDELKGIDGVPIFHWFTGTKTELDKAIDIGAWFSVGPAMLNSKKGKEIIGLIPKDRLLTETDAPFAKFSGKIYSLGMLIKPLEVYPKYGGVIQKLLNIN